MGDGGSPYCLHGLNAVCLPDFGWYRIDARGNRADVHAAFSPPQELLAFPIREAAERDFPVIFASPLSIVVEALRAHTDIFMLAASLPDLEQVEISAD